MSIFFDDSALLVGIAVLFLLLALLRRHGQQPVYLLFFAVFWVYLLAAASLTLFPIHLPEESRIGTDWQTVYLTLRSVNLIPFHFGSLFSSQGHIIRTEIAGNILLTVPFGFGFPFLARMRWREAVRLGLGVGLAIEGWQLLVKVVFSSYRGVDINDVLLNGLGVLLGYGIFRIFARAYPRASRVLRRWARDRWPLIRQNGLLDFIGQAVAPVERGDSLSDRIS